MADKMRIRNQVAEAKDNARCQQPELGGHVQTGIMNRITRHKISDRWRGSLQVECGSHRKLEGGAASGSLHRLVTCLPVLAAFGAPILHRLYRRGMRESRRRGKE